MLRVREHMQSHNHLGMPCGYPPSARRPQGHPGHALRRSSVGLHGQPLRRGQAMPSQLAKCTLTRISQNDPNAPKLLDKHYQGENKQKSTKTQSQRTQKDRNTTTTLFVHFEKSSVKHQQCCRLLIIFNTFYKIS